MADLLTLRKFEALSPFEIKNELINLAKATSKTTQSAFLDAGRGNPNWVATTPREGFFLLGQFAITESKRTMEESPGIGGMPQAKGIAARLDAWLAKHLDMPGADFLSSMVKFAIKTFGFDPGSSCTSFTPRTTVVPAVAAASKSTWQASGWRRFTRFDRPRRMASPTVSLTVWLVTAKAVRARRARTSNVS